MPNGQGLVAAIDMGTAKVACLIGQADRQHGGTARIRVLGLGQRGAHGIDRGTVVDLGAAEDAVRGAVEEAEGQAGLRIRRVHVNLSSATLTSYRTNVEVPIPAREIATDDLRRVLGEARARLMLGGRVLVHAVPLSFHVDGSRGIRDPRGMMGRRLGVNLHILTAAPAPVRNLKLCIERSFLDMVGLIATPYASGLACLVEDEMQMGATVIDLGQGTTSLAMFHENRLVDAGVLEVGGGHVTRDLSVGLSTPLDYAERLKTLHGSALPSPTDEREHVDVPQIGEEATPHRIPKSLLVGIVRPRAEEILELARDRMWESEATVPALRRVVLTGGGSLLPGLRELAERILNCPVRIGRPRGLEAAPEIEAAPGLSACAGLAWHWAKAPFEAPHGPLAHRALRALLPGVKPRGRLRRWLRAVF